MKFIKQAKIETESAITNPEGLISELNEARDSGINLSEYTISYNNNSYSSLGEFITTTYKLASPAFNKMYEQKIIGIDDFVEFSFEEDIPNIHAKIDSGEINFDKVQAILNESQNKNSNLKSNKFYITAREVYPELVSRKLVITTKNDLSLKKILESGTPGLISGFTNKLRTFLIKANHNTDDKSFKEVGSIEYREIYDGYDNQYRVTRTYEDTNTMVETINLFDGYDNIQKVFYQNFPNKRNDVNENKRILEKFLMENSTVNEEQSQEESKTILNAVKFAEKMGISTSVQQDFSKENVYFSFIEIVKNGDLESIKRVYSNLVNIPEAMKIHTNSSRNNPVLYAESSEIVKYMLLNMSDITNSGINGSCFNNLRDTIKINDLAFKAMIDNLELIPGYKTPIIYNKIIETARSIDLLDITFEKFNKADLPLSKMEDISDILETRYTDEPGKNISTAIKHGYNPMKIDKHIQSIVTERDTKKITALKKLGITNPKSNSFFASIIRCSDATASFDKYCPDVLDASVWNFKNHDNSLLWWNANQLQIINKIDLFASKNPNTLKISTVNGSFLNTIFKNLTNNNRDKKDRATTLMNTAIDIAKTTEQKLSMTNSLDENNSNILHKALNEYYLLNNNGAEVLKSLLDNTILDVTEFKEMFNQKNSKGRYPMDSLMDSNGYGNFEEDFSKGSTSDHQKFISAMKIVLSSMENTVGTAFFEALIEAPNSFKISSVDFILKKIEASNISNQPIPYLENINSMLLKKALNKHIHELGDDNNQEQESLPKESSPTNIFKM